MTQIHLRTGTNPHKYACGLQNNRWVGSSISISSTAHPWGITCKSCKRTLAFREAAKQYAEE